MNYNIQDAFFKFGPTFIKTHKLSVEQWKVYNSIINCKTGTLGYHTITCEYCGEVITSPNSCRNRHCPMCQNYQKEKWIDNEMNNVLDCPYFHIITTVPHELNEIFKYNEKICYKILFKATYESISTLTDDPKWLGAKVGITSILHTWGQTMEYHPHIHSIVTGGGINGNKWINSENDYLFKIEVLSSLFKQKFLSLLKKEDLKLPKHLSHLKNMKNMNDFLRPLYNKDWVCYIKKANGNPEYIIKYIGRYSYRVAISNERIKNITDKEVTFEYRDYKDNGKIKLMTISGEEFIRRFLMHVLPKRFTKIKHYGLLSNRNKTKLIRRCRYLIGKLLYNDFKNSLSSERKPYEFRCEKCGHNKFIYSFHYRPTYSI